MFEINWNLTTCLEVRPNYQHRYVLKLNPQPKDIFKPQNHQPKDVLKLNPLYLKVCLN
jgi:hypothetical protein